MINKKIVALVLIGGFIAGIAGELALRFYFFKDLYNVPYGNDLNLAGANFNRSNLVINSAQKVIVNSDIKTNEITAALSQSLYGIFKVQASSSDQTKLTRNDFYDLNNPVLSAIAVSGDGWLLASAPSALNIKNLPKNYLAIGRNKKAYAIDKVFAAPTSGLWLIHLAGVRDLPVRNFGTTLDLSPGTSALALNWQLAAAPTTIVSNSRLSSLNKSADNLTSVIKIAQTLPTDFGSAWLLNLNGDLLGLIDKSGNLLSSAEFKSALLGFFQTNNLATPLLGLNYLDLSLTAQNGNGRFGESLKQIGALISADANHPAIVKGSPADLVGLKAGDLIIAVDGVEINENNDLGEIIQGANVGEEVNIKYVRAGLTSEVKVKLGLSE